MKDKAHCRIDLEDEATLAELAPYYDLQALRARYEASAFANGAFVDRTGEVVLRNGTRLTVATGRAGSTRALHLATSTPTSSTSCIWVKHLETAQVLMWRG